MGDVIGSPSNHGRQFDALLADLRRESGLTDDVFGRVLFRVAVAAPEPVSQAQIARGEMMRGAVPIPTTTVSRAVAALESLGLGDRQRYQDDGN